MANKYDQNDLNKKIQQARDAGIPELEIQKRVKLQFGVDMAPVKKTVTPSVTTNTPTPTVDPGEAKKQGLENNWLVGPLVKYGGTVLEAGRQALNFATDKDYRDLVIKGETESSKKAMELRNKEVALYKMIRLESDPTKKADLQKQADSVKKEADKLSEEVTKSMAKIEGKAKPKFMSEKQLKTTVEKPVETTLKNVAGAASYVIPAGKGVKAALALGAATGGLRAFSEENATPESVIAGMAGGGVAGGIFWGGGKIIQKDGELIKGGAKNISDKAAQDFIKASPGAYKKAAETGLDLRKVFKKYNVYGSYDDLVGTIEEANGGVIQQGLDDAERVIQGVIKSQGKQKISTQPVINQLTERMNELSKIPGNEQKVAALSEFITNFAKYGKTIPAKEALIIKRAADSAFGKAIVEDTKGTVNTQAQKLVANTFRTQLKTQFPTLGKALDQQHELLVLKEVLKDAQYKGASRGLGVGRFDISRPGTLIEPLTRSGPVASRIAGKIQEEALNLPKKEITEEGIATFLTTKGTGILKTIGRQSAIGGVGDLVAKGVTPELPEEIPTTSTAPGETPETSGVDEPDMMDNSEAESERRMRLAYMMYKYPKQATQIKNLYEVMYGKLDAKTTNKALPAAQVAELADIKSSVEQMDALDKGLDKYKGVMGPVNGRVRGANPYDVEAQAFQSDMMLIAQNVGRALEGGVLRQEDMRKYQLILPQISDTPEVARRKIANVKARLQNKLEQRKREFKGSGYTPAGEIPANLSPEDQSQYYPESQVPATPDETTFNYLNQ